MDLVSNAVLEVLTYLLPGFITAAVVYNLTPAPKPSPFERIVQALIFTMVIQVLVLGLGLLLLIAGGGIGSLAPWSDGARLTWSVLLAVGMGVLLAYLANSDRLHCVLRKLKITNQTSYSSEWYGALCQNRGFVVLHLSGGRRLYGWPQEWPSTPQAGHFVVSLPEWLTDDGSIEPSGVDTILVRAQDVELVELMRPLLAPAAENLDG